MLFIHILAAISGIASSTVRNIALFRRRDYHPALPKIVGVSTLLLFVSGFGLLLDRPHLLNDPSFFLKMFFVGMLLTAEVYLVRKPTVWAGFASFFSWYFSFFWQGLERINFGRPEILGFYFGVIFISFIAARKYGYT